MEIYLLSLLENGGVVGAFVVIAVLVIAVTLKLKLWVPPSQAKLVRTTDLSELSGRVGEVEERLNLIDGDLRHMPSKEDYHELDIRFTRLDEKLKAVQATTRSTGSAVARIEQFMIDVSKEAKK